MDNVTESYMDYSITKVNVSNIDKDAYLFVFSFIYSFTHKIFIEYFPCASDCSKHLRYMPVTKAEHTVWSTHWRRGGRRVLDIISKHIQW